jgi:hypothetical protein
MCVFCIQLEVSVRISGFSGQSLSVGDFFGYFWSLRQILFLFLFFCFCCEIFYREISCMAMNLTWF